MALIRRTVHVVAWLGTVIVILVSLAFITSQTPWFRDWIRRAIVREAKQYLNGELTIGQLGGNLFFGATLSDVAVDLSGDRVIAVKSLEIDYSVLQLVSKGLVIDRIALASPAIHVVRDDEGWNLGRLVKERRREADRKGPARPLSLRSIVITDGTVRIDDQMGSSSYTLPRRIADLDVRAGFEYEPVHFTLELDQLTLRASDPNLTLRQLTGGFAVRDDNLYFERVVVNTDETSATIEGVVEQYLRTPVIKVTSNGRLSLPEISRLLPVLAEYPLHPAFTVKADGTIDKLGLDLDVQSEAGLVRGKLVTDFKRPDTRFAGSAHVERLNLAPILKKREHRSDISGDAVIDLAIRSEPAGVPALDRLEGRFRFQGPRALAFGYEGTGVSAAGTLKGPRITLTDSRANAYGASATARGAIVLPSSGRAVSFDLQGTARDVDMRRLPATMRAPRLATNLSVLDYHVRGTGSAVEGSATLDTSEVEGATIASGTVGEFQTGKGAVSYGGRGSLSELNVQRLGRALGIEALDDPRYDGRVSGTFDVKGAGTTLQSLALEASGTLRDSVIMRTRMPEMAFKTTIADAGLTVYAKGAFNQLNPAVISERKQLDGNLNGTVDGTFRIADLTADLTPASFDVDGRVTIGPSLIGGVQIVGADVEGRYAAEVADLKHLQVKGPDVTIEASGRLALDRSSESNLKYRLDAPDISEAGALVGQQALDGSVVLDGTITGNRAALATSGTLDGSGLAWKENKALELDSKYAVTVPDLAFASAKVQAESTATFVQLGGLELNKVTATTTYAKKELEFTTRIQEKSRELEATGRAIFHPDHQEIHLPQFAIRTEGVAWQSGSGGDPVIQYRPGQVTLKDISLVRNDQALDVNGTVSLGAAQPTGSLVVRARNVDLAEAERLLLIKRGLQGRLTADATITGSTTAPIVDGHVEVRGGAFQNYKYESLVADVDYAGKRVTLDANLQQAPGVSITARGVAPTSLFERTKGEHVVPTAEDAIDLRVQSSSLDLGVVQGFTTAITNVSGGLQADIRVTGSGHDPHVTGFAEIRDGAFSVPRAGTAYSGLDTRIDLEEDVVRIRRFEILDENGEQFGVSGQLAVHARQLGAVDITLDSQNFEIIDNELGDVGIGSALKITGELARPRLEGDVRIAAGRLEVDRILQLFYDPYRVEELPEVESAERTAQAAGSAREATTQALARAGQGAAPPEAQPPAAEAKKTAAPAGLFDNVQMDVRLRIPDNLILRGRKIRPGGPTRAAIGDINITVGGDLTIRKESGGQPTLTGTITTVRGTYQFQGRQFELARGGTVRFTGDADLNPILDVTATREIPDTGVEARVRITGNAKLPELQLSSTPPLDESDILSLIVFNRPVNELGSGERTSLAATAGGIATGFIATPLGQSIGKALDLDLFEINTMAEGESIGAELTVGEQIGDKTFFKLRQTFGDRTYSEFLLEYQIADFLRFVGSGAPEASNAGNRIGQRRIERAGVNLIFFFSY
jgi:autotransporter translocation and assembly factor TamB